MLDATFHCRACGDVIGVYEPLVVLSGAGTRTTSRAAEPHLPTNLGEHFHRECYTLRDGLQSVD